MLKEGVILGERYEIISRIGSGGMADVYKAKDRQGFKTGIPGG